MKEVVCILFVLLLCVDGIATFSFFRRQSLRFKKIHPGVGKKTESQSVKKTEPQSFKKIQAGVSKKTKPHSVKKTESQSFKKAHRGGRNSCTPKLIRRCRLVIIVGYRIKQLCEPHTLNSC